jgi:hypothetical protein
MYLVVVIKIEVWKWYMSVNKRKKQALNTITIVIQQLP